MGEKNGVRPLASNLIQEEAPLTISYGYQLAVHQKVHS